jgi:molecular chaperone DnaK
VLVLAAGVVALVLLAGAGVGLAVLGGDDDKTNPPGEQTSTNAESPLPADEQCTDAIMSNPRWVCLTSAIVADGKITIDYRGDGSPLSINGGYHLHIYGGDGVSPSAGAMGMQVPPAEQGKWYVEDRHPAELAVTDERFLTAIGDAPKVCARIADGNHHLVPDAEGTYATGNCVPITRTVAPATTDKPNTPTRQPTRPRTTTTTQSSTTTVTTTSEPPDSSDTEVQPTESPAP